MAHNLSAISALATGTASAWNSTSLPIPSGVMCIESDTGKVKVGNGTSLYQDLPYRVDELITADLKQMIEGIYAVQQGMVGPDGKIKESFLPTAVLNNLRFVPDITARDALDNKASGIVVVVDATGDTTVKSGGASYVWDGLSDSVGAWTKVSETESMDIDSDQFLSLSKMTLDNVRDGVSFIRMSQDDTDALGDLNDTAVTKDRIWKIDPVMAPLFGTKPEWKTRTAIVGEVNQVLYTDDAGATWKSVATPEACEGVCVSNDVLLVGAANGKVYRSVEPFTSWTLVLTGYSQSLTIIDVPEWDSIYIIPHWATQGIYRSKDHGLTWQTVATGRVGAGRGALFNNGRLMFSRGNYVIYTDNDGANWHLSSSAGATFESICTNGTIILGYVGGSAYRSVDNGLSWSRVGTVAVVPTDIRAIGCSAEDGYFVAIGAGNTIGSYYVSPNGTNWSVRYLTGAGGDQASGNPLFSGTNRTKNLLRWDAVTHEFRIVPIPSSPSNIWVRNISVGQVKIQ